MSVDYFFKRSRGMTFTRIGKSLVKIQLYVQNINQILPKITSVPNCFQVVLYDTILTSIIFFIDIESSVLIFCN